MNVQLYWKYLVGLFIYAIVLNIPFLIYIDAISNAITSFFSIHETDNSVGYFIYSMMILIQLPLVSHFTKSTLYDILYVVTCILVAVLNPFSFITTPYQPWYLFVVTAIVFFCLKLSFTIVTVALLILLAVLSSNEILSFYYKSSYAFLAYFLLYLIGYAKSFIDLDPARLELILAMIRQFFNPVTNFFDRMYQVIKQFGIDCLSINPFFLCTFAVFIGFALFHLYIRTISKQAYGGTMLVHKPIPLDTVTSYSVPVNYHYTLSFWFYIHPTPPSYSPSATEYTTLLLHGDNVLISYNGQQNKIRVRLKDDTMVTRTVPLQKWNHMTLIYQNGMMDIFMNGKLIESETWVPHTLTNELLIGANKGIHGDICNVLYYDKVMTHAFVQSLYHDFKKKNPPIV
jgi:hypothetical protein